MTENFKKEISMGCRITILVSIVILACSFFVIESRNNNDEEEAMGSRELPNIPSGMQKQQHIALIYADMDHVQRQLQLNILLQSLCFTGNVESKYAVHIFEANDTLKYRGLQSRESKSPVIVQRKKKNKIGKNKHASMLSTTTTITATNNGQRRNLFLQENEQENQTPHQQPSQQQQQQQFISYEDAAHIIPNDNSNIQTVNCRSGLSFTVTKKSFELKWVESLIAPYYKTIGINLSNWCKDMKKVRTKSIPNCLPLFGEFSKLFVYKLLPINIEKVLVLDTDLFAVASLDHLWEDSKLFADERNNSIMAVDASHQGIVSAAVIYNIPVIKEWIDVNNSTSFYQISNALKESHSLQFADQDFIVSLSLYNETQSKILKLGGILGNRCDHFHVLTPSESAAKNNTLYFVPPRHNNTENGCFNNTICKFLFVHYNCGGKHGSAKAKTDAMKYGFEISHKKWRAGEKVDQNLYGQG